jgi:hypothetical protein
MKNSGRWMLASAIVFALAACSSGPGATGGTAMPVITTDLTPTIVNILAGRAEPFTDLQPGRYALDPDLDPSTPLRVSWEIPAEGWQSWIGAAKFSAAGHSGFSVTTVSNLVTDGCRDHSWADPPVGPSVDDLAEGLADLAPFRVTAPPQDVTAYGYAGKHLELTVPRNQSVSKNGDFVGCDEGKLKSWVAAIDAGEPGDAFYGYTGGDVEEIWILDVDGTRLMIETAHSPGTPSKDLEELSAILDSIEIQP